VIKTILIGLGRVGAGNIGLTDDVPMSHLSALSANPYYDLAALIDPNQTACQLAQINFPDLPYAPVQNLRDLASTDLDVAVIATPPKGRLELFQELLQRSPRLIVCEKPLARTLKEAVKIVAACDHANVQLRVNFHRRFDPRHQKWRKRRPSNVKAIQMRYGRGLWNYASHQIDLIQDWYGPITKVQALGPTSSTAANEPTVSFSCATESVEQIVVLGMDNLNFDQLEADFIGRDGILVWRAGGAEMAWYEPHKDRFYKGYTHIGATPAIEDRGPVGGFAQLYEAIHEHLTQGTVLAGCDGQQALHTMTVLDAVLTSAKRGCIPIILNHENSKRT